MMVSILLALALGAICHFVYESILAPSFRLKLRFELLALCDELRQLETERDPCVAAEAFEYLQGSLHTLASVLDRFDCVTLNALEREIRRNPEVRARVERQTRVLDACGVAEYQKIRTESLRIAVKAVVVNNAIACLYLLPIILCAREISRVKRVIKESLSLRAPEICKYAPAPDQHVASLV